MILLEIRIHCRAVRIFDVWQLRAAGDEDLLGSQNMAQRAQQETADGGGYKKGRVYLKKIELEVYLNIFS